MFRKNIVATNEVLKKDFIGSWMKPMIVFTIAIILGVWLKTVFFVMITALILSTIIGISFERANVINKERREYIANADAKIDMLKSRLAFYQQGGVKNDVAVWNCTVELCDIDRNVKYLEDRIF